MVEEAVRSLWDKFGLQRVFLQEKGFFIFRFSLSEDRDNVLAMGPWYISNKLLCLKPWKEGLDFQFDTCFKAPVWVKFHNIPLSYLSSDGLSYIVSAVGKPLFVDKLTEKLEPMNFSRVCMPNSLDLVVIDEDTEKIITGKVEYQNRPQLCSHCKSFGHSLVICPKANFKWVPKAQSVPNPPVSSPILAPILTRDSPSKAFPITTNEWTLVSKGPKPYV